jgi:hypothetical protein
MRWRLQSGGETSRGSEDPSRWFATRVFGEEPTPLQDRFTVRPQVGRGPVQTWTRLEDRPLPGRPTSPLQGGSPSRASPSSSRTPPPSRLPPRTPETQYTKKQLQDAWEEKATYKAMRLAKLLQQHGAALKQRVKPWERADFWAGWLATELTMISSHSDSAAPWLANDGDETTDAGSVRTRSRISSISQEYGEGPPRPRTQRVGSHRTGGISGRSQTARSHTDASADDSAVGGGGMRRAQFRKALRSVIGVQKLTVKEADNFFDELDIEHTGMLSFEQIANGMKTLADDAGWRALPGSSSKGKSEAQLEEERQRERCRVEAEAKKRAEAEAAAAKAIAEREEAARREAERRRRELERIAAEERRAAAAAAAAASRNAGGGSSEFRDAEAVSRWFRSPLAPGGDSVFRRAAAAASKFHSTVFLGAGRPVATPTATSGATTPASADAGGYSSPGRWSPPLPTGGWTVLMSPLEC